MGRHEKTRPAESFSAPHRRRAPPASPDPARQRRPAPACWPGIPSIKSCTFIRAWVCCQYTLGTTITGSLANAGQSAPLRASAARSSSRRSDFGKLVDHLARLIAAGVGNSSSTRYARCEGMRKSASMVSAMPGRRTSPPPACHRAGGRGAPGQSRRCRWACSRTRQTPRAGRPGTANSQGCSTSGGSGGTSVYSFRIQQSSRAGNTSTRVDRIWPNLIKVRSQFFKGAAHPGVSMNSSGSGGGTQPFGGAPMAGRFSRWSKFAQAVTNQNGADFAQAQQVAHGDQGSLSVKNIPARQGRWHNRATARAALQRGHASIRVQSMN